MMGVIFGVLTSVQAIITAVIDAYARRELPPATLILPVAGQFIDTKIQLADESNCHRQICRRPPTTTFLSKARV